MWNLLFLFSFRVSFRIMTSQLKVFTCFYGFFNNSFTNKVSLHWEVLIRKLTRKPEEAVWHNICFNKRVFSIKKTEIVLRVTKTAKICIIAIFLVVASWSRTHFESFPLMAFHNTMTLKKWSFEVAVFHCIMAI